MSDARLHGWDPAWIAELLDVRSRRELDQRLVDALRAHGPCLSVELWRLEQAGLHRRWQRAASVGPSWSLPDASRVRAVLDGGLDSALLGGARVVSIGGRELDALALFVPIDTPAEVDEMAEALLVLERTLRAAIEPGEAA